MSIVGRLDNGTITRRIFLAFAALAGIGMLMTVAVLVSMGWVNSWANSHEATQEQVEAAATISEASANMIIFGTAVVISENNQVTRAEYAAIQEQAKAEVLGAPDVLATLEGDDEEDAVALASIGTAFDQTVQALEEAIGQASSTSSKTLALTRINTVVLPAAAQLDELTSSYTDNELAQARSALDDLSKNSRTTIVGVAVMLALLLAATFVSQWVIPRFVKRQVRAAGSSSQEWSRSVGPSRASTRPEASRFPGPGSSSRRSNNCRTSLGSSIA